ncbi:hypothetical protein GE09DRAFT_1065856 [Coniochaeta sp. 2T2.1]|nr:hypothetical protein GE09DRAFT_1065856 [Coniochaeta sp. 2T2.1]
MSLGCVLTPLTCLCTDDFASPSSLINKRRNSSRSLPQEVQDFETRLEEMEKKVQAGETELEDIKSSLKNPGELSTEDQARLNDANKLVQESRDKWEALKNQNTLMRQMIEQNIRRVKNMLGI